MDRDTDRRRKLETRAAGLVGLLRGRLPLDFPPLDVDEAWLAVGAGLLSRQAGTVESIALLGASGRRSDSLVLTRSLFDHAVTFAWLAVDPGPKRQRQFLKTDSWNRLRADDDCRKLGVPILTDAMRRQFEMQAAIDEPNLPSLLDRAAQADSHWTGRVPGLRGADQTHSFRGIYATVYRHYSAYEHASVLGLNPVTIDLPTGGKRVALEPSEDGHDQLPLGTATVLLGFSLGVAARTLGWPTSDEVEDLFAAQ